MSPKIEMPTENMPEDLPMVDDIVRWRESLSGDYYINEGKVKGVVFTRGVFGFFVFDGDVNTTEFRFEDGKWNTEFSIIARVHNRK